ncbi:MAG: hypothetical protein J5719_02575, partial [Bacteroidales bacterium]|nr:hypothetical protein [Bacteroidales bacterium]
KRLFLDILNYGFYRFLKVIVIIMGKRVLPLIILLCVILLSACKEPDLTPSYIEVAKEDVTMNMYNFNTLHNTNFDEFELAAIADQDFADIWITADGNNMGTWELPCKLPLLDRDSVQLIMTPGILMNGMSTTRPKYPFVQAYKAKFFFEKENATRVQAHVQYYNNVYFPLIETFEGAGISFTKRDSTHVDFNRTTDPDLIYRNPLQPGALNMTSGVLTLADTITSFEVVSEELQLPGQGYPVFLEMDYKCDKEMYVGLLTHQTTSAVVIHDPLVNIRPTDKWKKIYINLTQCLGRRFTNAQSYQVIISSVKDKTDTNDANFYFDNIKVVYLY